MTLLLLNSQFLKPIMQNHIPYIHWPFVLHAWKCAWLMWNIISIRQNLLNHKLEKLQQWNIQKLVPNFLHAVLMGYADKNATFNKSYLQVLHSLDSNISLLKKKKKFKSNISIIHVFLVIIIFNLKV